MTAPAPELSRPVPYDRISAQGTEITIDATAEERAALAKRFGLERIEVLRAEVKLVWLDGKQRLRLEARIHADVVQACVISLEPVENSVDDTVEILFEPPADGEAAREVVVEGADEAEPLPEDPIDVGEIIAEEFALSLDPYPRRPDVGQAGESAEEIDESPIRGPFQELARLKRDH